MTVRVAVIGAGSAATRHVTQARRAWPGATIGVVRRAQERPPWADVRLDGLEAIADFGPDVGIVAAPAPVHVDATRTLLDAGATVLLEKPVSDRLEDARDLAIHPRADRVLVGYTLRFTSGFATLQACLADGRVGRPLATHAEVGQWLPAWRPGTDHRAGPTASVSSGGGALLELSHEFDYLRALVGEPTWVMADVRRVGEVTVDADDLVHAILGVPGGVATAALDLLRRDPHRLCTVIGDGGTATWDALAGRVTIDHGRGREVVLEDANDLPDAPARLWDHFVDVVKGQVPPRVTLADGCATLEVLDACRRSSRDGVRTAIEVAP